MLNIKWHDHLFNTDVLRRSGIYGMEALIMQRQLKWCGYVLRMENHRLSKIVFFSELTEGKRNGRNLLGEGRLGDKSKPSKINP